MGPEHAKLTEQSFSVALDSLQTVVNVKSLGMKKLARRVARETGKGAGEVLQRCRLPKLKMYSDVMGAEKDVGRGRERTRDENDQKLIMKIHKNYSIYF